MRGNNFGGGVVLGDVGPANVWMDMDRRDMIIGHSTQSVSSRGLGVADRLLRGDSQPTLGDCRLKIAGHLA